MLKGDRGVDPALALGVCLEAHEPSQLSPFSSIDFVTLILTPFNKLHTLLASLAGMASR